MMPTQSEMIERERQRVVAAAFRQLRITYPHSPPEHVQWIFEDAKRLGIWDGEMPATQTTACYPTSVIKCSEGAAR